MTDDEAAPRRQHSTLSSVRNAARLLKEFSRGSREIGVTELSRRLGIGKSTAHRLLNTLAEERLAGGVFVGDGLDDIHAAERISARFVLAGWGYGAATLRGAAAYVQAAARPEDLLHMIEETG